MGGATRAGYCWRYSGLCLDRVRTLQWPFIPPAVGPGQAGGTNKD
jgi:hypothetical protein